MLLHIHVIYGYLCNVNFLQETLISQVFICLIPCFTRNIVTSRSVRILLRLSSQFNSCLTHKDFPIPHPPIRHICLLSSPHAVLQAWDTPYSISVSWGQRNVWDSLQMWVHPWDPNGILCLTLQTFLCRWQRMGITDSSIRQPWLIPEQHNDCDQITSRGVSFPKVRSKAMSWSPPPSNKGRMWLWAREVSLIKSRNQVGIN